MGVRFPVPPSDPFGVAAVPARPSPFRVIRRAPAARPLAALTLLAALAAGVAPLAGCGTEVEEGVVPQSAEEPEYPEDY